MGFDLAAEFLEWVAEELLHFAAAETDYVGMFLLAAGLVIMLFASLVHQVEFVHQTALFQQLQRAIHRYPVQFRIFFLGQLKKPFRIEVIARLVDEVEQDLALPRKADATFRKQVPG
ncbi:MAG TPA: hypothetical protein VNH18_22075 [Bryobacteraceae bacterium]|nr:hypothetical protein [Bryobacteraceae bacterium]